MPITPLVAPVSFRFQNFFVTCWNFGPSLQGLSLTLKGFIQFLKGCFFRKYRKKALLIGIINTGDSKDLLELKGPHHDVLALQELIIRQYGYKHGDVVVMLDRGVVKDPKLVPTRANILREIKNLVKGAQPGDHFLLHFSGHSMQVLNRNGTEEDGKDEAVIAADGKILIDDILKKYLVDPLPVDCSLVAIFDTCHSGSMLDLPHYRCNRVYVPWISKESSIMTPGSSSMIPRQQLSIDSVVSANFSTDTSADEGPRRMLSIDTQCLQMSPIKETTEFQATELGTTELELGLRPSSILLSPVMRCSSPQCQYALQCDGFSLCQDTEGEFAHVIALGACKDAQVAWEGESKSLTTILINILKEDPHPRLKDMMVLINHRTYAIVRQLHEKWKEFDDAYRNGGTRRLTDDEESQRYRMIKRENPLKSFQDPQLASHKKLDMNAFFTL